VINSICLDMLGQRVRVEFVERSLRALLLTNFGAMARTDDGLPPHLHYIIRESDGGIAIERVGQADLRYVPPDGLLSRLEKAIIVDLQKQRPDLLFLHAAAIEWQGMAYLFAADSGSGKSTTTWAMLHHGFGYLSDELSPIDLKSFRVLPYPHALCLKQAPPMAYPLPDATVRLERTMHVPTESLPGRTVTAPLPLGGIFLLRYDPALMAPKLRPIGRAEAGARLYVNALNALAHKEHGLDAIVRVVGQRPCYAVSTAALAESCELIVSMIEPAGPC
jgi:hypothetical protein